MSKEKNVFISHYGKDDKHVQNLKKRLSSEGYTIKNSSIDSTKPNRVISNAAIERLLRMRINWAGTFICLVGKKTHTRDWVNYEIEQAHKQGKRIIGIYTHGSTDAILPENLKKYGGPIFGWNSLDKIGEALDGKNFPSETPDGKAREPIYDIARIKC